MLHSEPCIAIIIAISARLGLIAYGTRTLSFKAKDFLEWLKYLRVKLTRKYVNIILDQCPIHTAKVVKDYCDTHNIRLVFTPAYNPWLQSCELIFSQCKNQYRKRMLNLKIGGGKSTVREEVIASIKHVKQSSFKRVCRYT